MFQGFSAEVWIEPNQTASQGQTYQSQKSESAICAIMGAGNSASIPCMDVLYKLFVDNELVILKLNPVNDYIGPYIVRTFRALIESNIMTVVYGGGDIGAYLCQHDSVDTIHITGSQRTHDLIVWGNTPDEIRDNKANKTPKLSKPITSKLGCVSPCIIVPGDWSQAKSTTRPVKSSRWAHKMSASTAMPSMWSSSPKDGPTPTHSRLDRASSDPQATAQGLLPRQRGTAP